MLRQFILLLAILSSRTPQISGHDHSKSKNTQNLISAPANTQSSLASYEQLVHPYLSDHQTSFVLNDRTLSMEYHEHENRNFQLYRQQQQRPLLERCDFHMINETGILYSPMFPEKLNTNRSVTCIWRIHSPDREKFSAVELNIQVANLRTWSSVHGNCSDSLVITYEADSKRSFKQIVMNSNTRFYPKKIISPTGELHVNLTICATQSSCPIFQTPPANATSSNSTKSNYQPTTLMALIGGKPTFFEPKYELITQPITGFYGNYRLIKNCTGCGVGDADCSEVHHCDSQCGFILSINYPLNYKNSHRCSWQISAPAFHYINITVNEFDVPSERRKHSDCMFDHVSFIDPSTSKLIGRYCNSNQPPKFILSAWNQLIIEFNSDSNVTGRGFSFSYTFQKYKLPEKIYEQHMNPPSLTSCPTNWSYYNNHCYQAFFGEQIIQWYDAEAACAEVGAGRNGHLVSILDSNEMSAVFHFLLNVWKSPAYKAFYIGLVDNFKEGSYRWSDGLPMSYTDWAPAQLELDEDEINPPQPDGGAFEDCTIMRFDFGHSTANWHDIPCSLGSHTQVVKSANVWLNNSVFSDLVNSYICKLDALTEIIEPKFVQTPMYKSLKVVSKETVLKSVNKQRNFICSNYEVISFLQKCDGVAQCSDNSDEHHCPNSKFILHRRRMEMQQSQLQQSNSEINLQPKFSNNRPSAWSLASFSLPQDSIEFIAKSTPKQNCLPEQYRCDNGRCISISMYCDYQNDCGDESDEKYCLNTNTVYADRTLLAKKNRHNLHSYNQTMKWQNLKVDLPTLGPNGCLVNEFKCNNGECIAAEKRCDLLVDCKDESDEGTVCSSGNHCNKNFTFQCYYGNCIPLYAVCDYHRDCPGKFHEDEQKQICQQRLLNTTQLSNRNNVNPNYANQYVEEQSTEVILNHLMFDRLAACKQSKKRTCLDLFLYHDVKISRRYQVKPENSHFSFEVYCRFPVHENNGSIIMQNIRTLVHHDSEIEMLVQTGKVLLCPWSLLPGRPKKNQHKANVNNPLNNAAIHRRQITYDVGLQSIKALISDSKQCRQLVHWRCKQGTPVLFEDSDPHSNSSADSTNHLISHWVSSEGVQMPFDECLQPNEHGSCTCENNTSAIDFLITDRTHLPLMEVRFVSPNLATSLVSTPKNQSMFFFNNQTNKKTSWALEGYHLIGPLECEGDSDDISTDFEDDCKDISNIELFQCQSGQIIKAKQRCIFDHDQYGYQIGCRDVTHLRSCENYECPDDYLKCPNSYCIPPRYICDLKKDCPNGEDEARCFEFECPGRYRCIETTYCIYLNQLCDGVRQCQMKGDDEWFCDLQCPPQCDCIGLYAYCGNRNLTGNLPPQLSNRLRKLDLNGNQFGPNLDSIDLTPMTRLGELILRNNRIEVVTSEKFIFLINLYLLDLSHNRIRILESRAFAGLRNVRTLYLNQNPTLSVIESNAFVGLGKLKQLNISHSAIHRLGSSAFAGLHKLRTLIFQSNNLQVIESGAFKDLSDLNYLDLRGNQIQQFKKDIFEHLLELKMLHTDSFKFCCLVHSQLGVPFESCLPLSDEISDCEDLMSSPLQRSFLWILGIIAFIFNLAVIFWRFKVFKKRSHFMNTVSSNLLLSLACADCLMGIYLLIIATVDQYYRGRYIEVSELWRKSILCKLCGFLSTMSSEASVFTLVAITTDRMICIVFPFSKWRFSTNTARRIIFTIWLLTFLVSILPILYTSYFRDEFYSRSGVCLALHITNRKPAGWEYAVGLFLVTNLLAFIFIVCCYVYMYKTVRQSGQRLTRMIQSKEVRERQVGKQMAMIVLTDFCCWCPIIILGLLAIFGVPISASVYSWIAVFILPVNSAVNPIIYTLVHFKPNLFRRKESLNNKSFYLLKPTGSIQASKNQNAAANKASLKAPPGYLTLSDFLKENRDLKMEDLLKISYLLNEEIRQVHSSGYAIGKINFHTVFVTNKITSNKIQVYLPDFYAYRVPNTPECDSDYSSDMEDFGILVKRMLQIYHSRLKYSYSFEYARKPSRNDHSEQSSRSSDQNLSRAQVVARESEQVKDSNESKSPDDRTDRGDRESNNNGDEIDLNQSTQRGNYENGYSVNSLNGLGQVDEGDDKRKQLIVYESNQFRDALIRKLKCEQNDPKTHLALEEEDKRNDAINKMERIERIDKIDRMDKIERLKSSDGEVLLDKRKPSRNPHDQPNGQLKSEMLADESETSFNNDAQPDCLSIH